ncbi:alpha-1,2-mannosidase, putative subfamily [Auriculariales sp. MPI-PUGE-AT-0066]|nr:alpha-1,2-mannosidase, putative subfamily [Auriculariales sp. MPI-PUGE-AT-0066]
MRALVASGYSAAMVAVLIIFVLALSVSANLHHSAGTRAEPVVSWKSPSWHVSPFIGTTKGGHVFPGATLPWGSTKVGADCKSQQNQAGYVSDDSPILGFSPLHDDGTGGNPSLGQFKVLPMWCPESIANCSTTESDRAVNRTIGSQGAHPGYFTLGLQSNIVAEMTVTDHAALYRFTWSNFSAPGSTIKPAILFDFADLAHSFSYGSQKVQFLNNSIRLSGRGLYSPSFGQGYFNVSFCLDVPHASAFAEYESKKIKPVTEDTESKVKYAWTGSGSLFQISDSYLSLSKSVALARIGISWTSEEKACQYAEHEIPLIDSAQFDKTQRAALAIWDRTLGTLELDEEGVSADRVVLFWSSLYRTYISPNNITGDNPLWDSNEPYYDSAYCLWDTARGVHPLLTITQREVQAQFVRALIDIYRHEGFLPDCRMSLCKGLTQGGSNADNVLSDSYVKGIRDGIDWNDGLAAMRADAEKNWDVEGRGGIEARLKYGYLPIDHYEQGGLNTRTVSRMLEYAFNDFSIALVAQGQADGQTAAQYLRASYDWQNVWDPNITDSGFQGFAQPRSKEGKFKFQDPRRCSPALQPLSCFLNSAGGAFYEAPSWIYSFYAPHDMASVIDLMGGKNTFILRLDALFDKNFWDPGNEPGFMNCFLYNYGGRPDKTVDRVLSILAAHWTTGIDGLAGNDDSGAMGAFAVFASFGFYPVAGTSVYLLSTPLFKTIKFPSSQPGQKAVLSTIDFDGAVQNKYIQSASLNGQSMTRNWFTHEEFFGRGGTLELTLGPKPSAWGTKHHDLPPSVSTAKSLAVFS